MRKSNHKGEVPAISEEEQIARYIHLIDELPESLTVKAHAAAFTELSADQRVELLDRLRPFLPQALPDATSEEPDVLASLVSSAEPREAMMRTAIAGVVAARFVDSAPVAAYFTVGLGSLTIDEQPSWVSELAHHESVPIDGGNLNHRAGIDFKLWG